MSVTSEINEAQAPQEDSLHKKTVKGLGWSVGSSLINAVMVIAYTSVVTRLVEPAAFGIVTASAAILRFGGYFSEMGLGKAIIQKAELDPRDVRAAFTGAMVLGILFTLLFVGLAPQIAPLFLSDPELVPILRLQSLVFLIGALNTVPTCLLKRKMDFARIAKTDIIGFILAYGGVGVTLSYMGYGIYGIAAAGMLSTFFTALINYYYVRHTLKPIFQVSAYKPMFGYGSRVSIISFIEFLTSYVDIFVIGRLLGSAILGFYSRAQMLVQLPVYNLTQALSKVLFPAMSSIQHDIPRLRRVYVSSITLLGMIIVPLCIGLSVAGREAILSVIGYKFEPAVPILQILAIMTPFRLMTYFGGIVCDSTGNLNVKIWTESIFVAINMGALWYAGSEFGVIGICYALLICEVARQAVYIIILKNILGFNLAEYFYGFIPVVVSAGFVGGCIALVRSALPVSILDLPLLALMLEAVAGGVGLFIGVMGPWSRGLRKEIFERFVAKTSFGSHKLAQVFVNL